MSKKLFIEKRQDSDDFAIRKPGAKRASDIEQTQGEAIKRAKELDPNATILVERVRHTEGGSPDKWRKP